MLFFISKTLGRDPADIAWLATANGIAQVLVGGYVGGLARKAKAYRVLAVSSGVMALGGLLVAFAWSLPGLVMGVIITSLGNAPFNISNSTIQQTQVDTQYFGRFSAALSTIGTAVFLSANSAAGYLVDSFTPRLVLMVSACVSIALAATAYFRLTPLMQKKDQGIADWGTVGAS